MLVDITGRRARRRWAGSELSIITRWCTTWRASYGGLDFHARTRMATFHSTPVHKLGGRSTSMAISTCLVSLVVLSGTAPSLTLFERTLTPIWGVYMLRSGSLADRLRQLMSSRPSIVSTRAVPRDGDWVLCIWG